MEPCRRPRQETPYSRERDPRRWQFRVQHRRQSQSQSVAVKSPGLELRRSADRIQWWELQSYEAEGGHSITMRQGQDW